MADNSKFGIAEAQIVGLFMESVSYGMFLVTFGLCIRALLFERDRSFIPKRWADVRVGMLLVAISMFIFATFDVAFGLRHNLDAFIFYHGEGGAAKEFSDISYWVNIMKTVDYVMQTAIGDAILNYRCWMVYNKSWKIVLFPVLMWMAILVCGIMMVYVEVTTTSEALLTESRITPWLDSIAVLTLVINILVTSLIVWRIWRVRSKTVESSSHPNRLSHVIRIVLDSGLMYTLCAIIFFGTTLAGSNAQYGVSDVIVQVIGITFNMIIIRVNNGTASEGISWNTSALPQSYPLRFYNNTVDPTFTVRTEVGVEVEVSQIRDTDSRVVKSDGPWKGAPGVHWNSDNASDVTEQA
ncbi:hypothetical protein PHLCEN_2v4136 [Hermanssonia centrifuga]|uniref:Uncharacterized protein n=1 Tax=Hermanssonia centrifuga TaxID=98765 RepID=A0A2R6PZ31_9APHY|nr:hypothetical protein PHLCEN_2v4136 [Hermanssonia centrifuga]